MPSPPPGNTPAHASTNDVTPKARRFLPEPIETTSKSSKTTRKHSPENAEPIKVRRFAPEPIETTTKSSRGHATDKDEKKPAPRRFAPEPIETTHKSSKETKGEKSASGHIRFKPQLVETTYGSNRKSSRQSSRTSVDRLDAGEDDDVTPRKFAPVVLSTAKRSRRAGDSNSANYQDYRTEEGHIIHAREHQKHAGWKTPTPDSSSSELGARGDGHAVSPGYHGIPLEGRRLISPLDGRPGPRSPALTQSRTHSFRCPDLDTIESSESERESGPSSVSCSPGQGSPITASDSSFNEFYKHATRARESVDETFSHYLLQLEAKKAEQRLLQEQTLAAFPNSDYHEPVQHYVNDDQDSLGSGIEDRPVTWEAFEEEEVVMRVRRESTKTPWEQMEMQRHAERLQEERNANRVTAAKKEEPSPWWTPREVAGTHKPVSEMRSMRDRARPPMLGNDLAFPRCPSPEPARFDVTQGCVKLREQMCYLSQHPESHKSNEGGLWAATGDKTNENFTSAAAKCATKSSPGKGLWGGFCVGKAENDSGLVPPSGPTGLMTPASRPDNNNTNPFDQSFAARNGVAPASSLAPPTPPGSHHGADPAQIDAMLTSELHFDAMFEREYPNSFITQVFNYLSLGYPSLARPFDEELSKISRIPIDELRQDDVRAKQNPRGYIRLGPDFEGEAGDGADGPDGCVRWLALRLYVREWARQEKDMVRVDAPGGNWATTNRRGSWAW